MRNIHTLAQLAISKPGTPLLKGKGKICFYIMERIEYFGSPLAPHSSTLAWRVPWMEEPCGLQSMGSLRVGHNWATSLWLFHLHALEKELAPHSSVLTWRIPGTGEPGGLPSMGSHRVGHDWSDLAAAANCCWAYPFWISLSIWWVIISTKKHRKLQKWRSSKKQNTHTYHWIEGLYMKRNKKGNIYG